MNALVLMRIAFMILASYVGYLMGQPNNLGPACAVAGFVASLALILLEMGADIIPAKHLLLAFIGLIAGLALGQLVARTVASGFAWARFAPIICGLAFGYLGTMFALKNAGHIDFSGLNIVGRANGGGLSILDTSVIVDGRVKDLVAAHFIRGGIIVPSFVLRELQALADSGDAQKRARGRRGLEILEEIKTLGVKLTVYEHDYPAIPTVDLKLIQLAKDINGEILTEDYNLHRVALLKRARAVNINELAALLRPAAHIGETITVFIAKEGKDPGQGVGYLDDGTMVVVDGGARRMRAEMECQITQILQTQTGRMLFARPEETAPESRS